MSLKSDLQNNAAAIQTALDDLVENIALVGESEPCDPSETGWLDPCEYDLKGSVYFSTYGHIPAAASHWNSMKVYHDRMAGSIPNGAVIFIGDSHIQGLCVSAAWPHSVNLGIGGDVMRGVINRTTGYEPLSRAGAVVLLIGVNDFSSEGANWIYNTPLMVEKIMSHFEGGPVLYCLIPPITVDAQSGYMQQANIDVINAKIISEAGNYPNILVVDIATPLKNGGTYLDSTYSLDGIHLNKAGQLIVINKLKEAL